MRIAIPMTGDSMEQHFGHCERFALLDIDSATNQISAKTEVKAPEHQPGLLPRWLKERDVTHVIAGGMGTHARSLCGELSIEVVAGAPSEAPEVLVRNYLDGSLVTNEHVFHHH